MKTSIAKIVSGGKAGADRGGFAAAIENSVPHADWCPKGRCSDNELDRTQRNVVDSHCTIVFTFGRLQGRSRRSVEFADKHGRPCLHVDLKRNDNERAAKQILEWLSGGGLQSPHCPPPPPNPVINVAGGRESESPDMQARTKEILTLVMDSPGYPPSGE